MYKILVNTDQWMINELPIFGVLVHQIQHAINHDFDIINHYQLLSYFLIFK